MSLFLCLKRAASGLSVLKERRLKKRMGKGGYGTVEFWNEWYLESDHVDPYDWLVEWEDVKRAVERYLDYDHDARILVVGCGNSPFSSELFAMGYRNLVNVDNCDSIIEKQRERYPMLEWVVGDVRRLPYEDDSFDYVLDKGCLDNLYCYSTADEAVPLFIQEVARVLRTRFILISCHDIAETDRSLESCSSWARAAVEIPNPRWPRIRIEKLSVGLCSFKEKSEGLKNILLDANTLSAPPLPARLLDLELRCSGLRQFSLMTQGD